MITSRPQVPRRIPRRHASPAAMTQPNLASRRGAILSRLTGRMIEIIPLAGERQDNAAGAGGVRKTPLRRCGRRWRVVYLACLQPGQVTAGIEAASGVQPL